MASHIDEDRLNLQCVLQCNQPCTAADSLDHIRDSKWNQIKEKSLQWKGLEKFGNVYDEVNWDIGPNGFYMHTSCHITLSSKRSWDQFQKRKVKSDLSSQNVTAPVSNSCTSESECSAPKKLRSSTGLLHDKMLCVWCMKGQSKKSDHSKKLLLLSTEDAWMKFKNHTIHIVDKETRERLNTLIASIPDCYTAFGLEIRYHRKCWRDNVSSVKPLTDENSQHLQHINLREAQVIFFEIVQQIIFTDHEFRTLQSLLRDYIRIISNYGHNSNVKSSYVKDILIKEFGDRIAFYERQQRNLSDIVYDNKAAGSYVEAALLSLGISEDQLLKNVASRLSKEIQNSKIIPWPALIPDLEKTENSNELLLKLITLLKSPNKKDIDDSPRVQAIASILTYYITGNRTAFTTNLSIMVHGLTKSKELIDIMHKEGLGISYNDVMMLRDLWAVNDLTHSLDCPFEIAEGEPAIAIVDNDNFRMDTLTGAGPQANRTNLMYVQPESLNKDLPPANIPDKHASRLSASLKELGSAMKAVTPYKTTKRAEPPVRNRPTDEQQIDTLQQRTRSVIHALARADEELNRPEASQQTVPGFSGFQARMCTPVEKSTPIFHTTYPENPNKSIINDIMDKLARSVKLKKMPFAVIVGDYPIYKLYIDLKSENPEKYAKLLPFMGPFHIQMSFIYCMYKRFQGSGIEDVLVAAGVVADGSCDQALRGKHFNRGVRCLRLFYEALVHHALNHRLEGTALSEEVKVSLKKLRELEDSHELRDAYTDLKNNNDIKNLVETLFRDSKESDFASLYISFMEMVEILTLNIHSLRTRNWKEFKSSLKLKLPWLKVYGNDKYGRHLPDFIASLDNLSKEQEDFMERGMFAQSMTGNPYSCVALEIWIESTMNKGSKLKNGWLAILNNEKQLASNVRNANSVNRIRGTVLKHAHHKKIKNVKHADCSKARMKTDEKAIQDISDCFKEFSCGPFELSNTQLRSLQSGIPASSELTADLKSAKSDGKKMVQEFMDERVFSKARSLNDRIPRSKRLNFANQELQHVEGLNAKGKAQEMERSALSAVVELVEISGGFELEDVLQHRVTEECLSIYNVNGTLRKTQKSKLMEAMTLNDKPEPVNYTAVIDMGLIWRLASPTTEDRQKPDGTTYTWGDYAQKLVELVITRHKKAGRIICINDTYTLAHSIKDIERFIRKSSKPVGNEHMKLIKPFPAINEFNTKLSKPENKWRLQSFLKKEFRKAAQVSNVEFIYCVVGEYADNLSKQTPEPDLLCLHAEADTALFTVYNNIRATGYVNPIIIDTEDTDNYVQAAYVSNKIPGCLLIKRKNTYIDAQSLCKQEMVDSIIPVHIITGSDHTSGFYGIGKKAVVDKVVKSSDARNLLASCGASLELTDETIANMSKFVIKYVYNDTSSSTPSAARAAKWRCQKKKSLTRIIPDSDSLLHHFKRVNYITFIQKNFHLNKHPDPLLHGWHLDNGLCLPTKSNLQALPRAMPEQIEQSDDNTDTDNDIITSDDEDCDESCGSDDYNNDLD